MSGVPVIYKCACMKKEATFEVPFRRADEDMLDWMNILTSALTIDHRQRSPDCRSQTVEYVKLHSPENADCIGGKPKVN